jgi:hypothetical protein
MLLNDANYWSCRSHVIHDLQPYLCTYYGCGESERLYGSRRTWVDHENTHRRRWRCYEHPEIVHLSPEGLREHLYHSHLRDQLTTDQVETLVELSAISIADNRPRCPVCFQDGPFHKGLENHLANHLERIALFALPRAIQEAGYAQEKSGKRSSRQSGDSLAAPVFDDPGRPNSVVSEESDWPRRSRSSSPAAKQHPSKRQRFDDEVRRARERQNAAIANRMTQPQVYQEAVATGGLKGILEKATAMGSFKGKERAAELTSREREELDLYDNDRLAARFAAGDEGSDTARERRNRRTKVWTGDRYQYL